MRDGHRLLGIGPGGWVLALGMFVAGLTSGCAPFNATGGLSVAPVNYAATIQDALQAYAHDMQGYHFRSTPVGNFGVGSIYLDDIGDPGLVKVETGWYMGGPDAWLETSAADRHRVLGRLIAEGSLGAFNVSASTAHAVSAQTGLAILSALTGSASLDYKKGVETSFHASEVRNRRLNWAEFENALKAGHINPAVAKVVREGKFVVAAADVVLVGYRAEIAVDESLNPALVASLRSNVLLPRLREARASFSVSEDARGHFVAIASEPVVAAVLFKRPPPQSKGLGMGKDRLNLDAWPAAQLGPGRVDAVEARILEDRR